MFRNAKRHSARNVPNFWAFASTSLPVWFCAASVAALVLIAASDAFANVCKPKRPLRAIVVTTMGPCHYDPETFSFAGDPVQQAACLIRPVARWAKLGPTLESLPRGGHDDPQNFDVESFARSLEMLLSRLSRTEEPRVLLNPAAAD